MKKILLILLAGSIMIFDGCKKTGPQGPVGPQGAQGNANVKGSDPFTVYGNTWQFSSNIYYADFDDADITTTVVDRGVVEIFKSTNTNQWTNLPDVYDGITSRVFDFFDNGFRISVLNSDFSDPGNPGNQTFRVVVITPSQKQAHPNTNWKNYTEAMAALGSANTVAPSATN